MPIIPGANYDFGKVFADVVMRNQSMQNERAMNAERLALDRARLDQQAQEAEDRRLDARESRAQQWAMHDAQQTAQWLIAKGGWDHASAQRAAQEKFQENMARMQFANQVLVEDTRNTREDARFDKQFGYTKERDIALDKRYEGEQKFKVDRAKAEDERFGAQFDFTKLRAVQEDERERDRYMREINRDTSNDKFRQEDINLRNRQIGAEEKRWSDEDTRRKDDRDANIRIKATEAAMDAVKYARQANPMLSEEAANKILNDTFDFTIGAMQAMQDGGKLVTPPTTLTAKQQREAQLTTRKAKQEDIDALVDAYDEGLRSPNADGTRGNLLGSIGRFGYGLGQNALKSMTLGLSGYLYPSPQEHAIKSYGAQAEEYMLGSGYTPEQVEMARKASLNKNRLGF